MKSDLSGIVVLVTGAARGIGKAIANRLIENDATVYYTDLKLDDCEAVATHDNARALAMDITSEEQVQAAVGQVLRDEGKIDVLINNAGVNTLHHRVDIDEFPREEWDRIVRIDLDGLYNVSRHFAAAMKKGGGGRIINIASVFGLVPARLQCAFVAAKAGAINLTKAMALELGPHGILVNGIAPGSILTEGTEKLFYGEDGKFHDNVQRFMDHVPLARPGSTDEIAVGVLFLADPENTYTNGHILTIDGGWMAGYHREF